MTARGTTARATMARALFVLASAGSIALTSADANACDCSTPSREVEFARAARVVVVRIDPGSPGAHVDRDGRERAATLPVVRSFKGDKPTVDVKLSAGKDCIYFPAEAGQHLVYLHAHGEGAPLEASICGNNGLVTSARGIAEIAALEALSRDAASAPAPSSAATPAPSTRPSAAPSAPAPPSRGCAGCTTGAGTTDGAPVALAVVVGLVFVRSRQRRARRLAEGRA